MLSGRISISSDGIRHFVLPHSYIILTNCCYCPEAIVFQMNYLQYVFIRKVRHLWAAVLK